MKALFKPRLVNEPHQDPALYVDLFGKKESYLIDLGDVSRLTTKKILRLSRIFVSHTHIDHFFGFDSILRVCLGKKTPLHIYGPRHIIRNVAGRIAGYTWNLIREYPLEIYVHELRQNRLTTAAFLAKNGLKRTVTGTREVVNGILHEDSEHSVRAVQLSHKVPVLAFVLEEKKRLNVRKDVLSAMKAVPGPWLNELKSCVLTKSAGCTLDVAVDGQPRRFTVDELAQALLLVKDGEKLLYVTDIKYSKTALEKLKEFVSSPDALYCEAFFDSADAARARERYHLTAQQTNRIAKTLGAKKLVIFHFSPRYKGNFKKIYQESYKDLR